MKKSFFSYLQKKCITSSHNLCIYICFVITFIKGTLWREKESDQIKNWGETGGSRYENRKNGEEKINHKVENFFTSFTILSTLII